MIKTKTIKIFFLVTLILTIGLLGLYNQQLQRLYHTLTLFDEDKIVSNFTNMRGIYQTIEITPSSDPSLLPKKAQDLPDTYQYKGAKIPVSEYISRTNTTALLVSKNYQLTYEDYYLGTDQNDYRISWSTAKSFLSALFGIAVGEGYIKSIDEAVSDYVPSLKGSGYDGVSIKDVLQMSSGVRFDEDYMKFNSDINRFGRTFAWGGSIDEFANTLVNEREPGTYMHYVSIDTHVLGMVLRAATGKPIADYFNEKLWSRFEPESSVHFIVDNDNEPMVLGGMNLRSRDFLRFGLLYLNKGKWKDQQVVPEQWIVDSITPDAPHLVPGVRETAKLALGYGYQWWIPENSDGEYMALGIYGQYIYVNAKTGVVIVKNSANTKFADNNFESATEAVAFFRAVSASLN